MGDRYSEPPKDGRIVQFIPALNPLLGNQMAIDGAFGGTPQLIHDGIDNVAATGTQIVGTKVTFNSTFTDVPNGWPIDSQSIEVDKPAVGDIWQFDMLSDVDLSNFIAFTMKIFVVSGWSVSNSIKVYGYDTGLAQQVGTSILIENFINEQINNVVQTVAIPLTVMGLEASTIDAIRVEVVSKSGPGVVFYTDSIQIEQTSGSKAFLIQAPASNEFMFFAEELRFTYADSSDHTSGYDSDKILGLAKLTNGITFTLVNDGIIAFDATITNLLDSANGGSSFENMIGTTTSNMITVVTEFKQAIELNPDTLDFIGIIINDNIALDSFTAIAKGFIVKV